MAQVGRPNPQTRSTKGGDGLSCPVPFSLFNTGLDRDMRRAIDFVDGREIDEKAF